MNVPNKDAFFDLINFPAQIPKSVTALDLSNSTISIPNMATTSAIHWKLSLVIELYK